MPTFHDPVADASEAREALRALAHATRSFEDPADTYTVTGELLGGLRSLAQVLEQVAAAHTGDGFKAYTDSGDDRAGVREAVAAADSLRQAASMVRLAELAVDRASQHSSRVVWALVADRPTPPGDRALLAPLGDGDPFAQRAQSTRRGLAL